MSPLSLWAPTLAALFVATVAAAWLHAMYADRDDLRAENAELRAELDRVGGRPASIGMLDGFADDASRLLGVREDGTVVQFRPRDWPS